MIMSTRMDEAVDGPNAAVPGTHARPARASVASILSRPISEPGLIPSSMLIPASSVRGSVSGGTSPGRPRAVSFAPPGEMIVLHNIPLSSDRKKCVKKHMCVYMLGLPCLD